MAPSVLIPKVFFDGACPLCRREIAFYRGLQGGDCIDWVDVSTTTQPLQSFGITRDQALARLHAVTGRGEVVSGALAFIEIWSHLRRFRLLAGLKNVPGMVRLLDLGYDGFLALRPLWRKPSCDRCVGG